MSDAKTPGTTEATILAGVPTSNKALFRRTRFMAGDPMALIDLPDGSTVFILRDIEVARARHAAPVDKVHPYEAFEIDGGLSGDREIRLAQSAAECLARAGVTRVRAGRSLPLLVADECRTRGMEVVCDRDLGVLDRRSKTDDEVAWLREAQGATEEAIGMVCGLIAGCSVLGTGELEDPGAPGEALTSERVMRRLDDFLRDRGYESPMHIVACGPEGSDCHSRGAGPLRTGQPIIIDVFPTNRETGYHGDCTRTVVHGDVPDEVARMHGAVVEALDAALGVCRAGATGDSVHRETMRVIEANGYTGGLPPEGSDKATEPTGFCSMQHGTGHGIGLDVHEPPLLDYKGPELVVGDALTVEPGLYAPGLGGVRVEDMVIVGADGCENLNRLPRGLGWA